MCCGSGLSAQINGRDLAATVTHLAADGFARFAIGGLLFRRELLRPRPAARRAVLAGQFLVASLRVEMPVAVEAVNADALALVTEVLEIVAICGIARRDQTLPLAKRLRLIDQLPLFERADGNLALPATLAPGILEHERIDRGPPMLG